jgi:hypothetical protein
VPAAFQRCARRVGGARQGADQAAALLLTCWLADFSHWHMRCKGLVYSIQIHLNAWQRKSFLHTQQVPKRTAAAAATVAQWAAAMVHPTSASQDRRTQHTHRATRLLGISSAHCKTKKHPNSVGAGVCCCKVFRFPWDDLAPESLSNSPKRQLTSHNVSSLASGTGTAHTRPGSAGMAMICCTAAAASCRMPFW